jgi:hypothetical protein
MCLPFAIIFFKVVPFQEESSSAFSAMLEVKFKLLARGTSELSGENDNISSIYIAGMRRKSNSENSGILSVPNSDFPFSSEYSEF